jgi:hypothetical protein
MARRRHHPTATAAGDAGQHCGAGEDHQALETLRREPLVKLEHALRASQLDVLGQQQLAARRRRHRRGRGE